MNRAYTFGLQCRDLSIFVVAIPGLTGTMTIALVLPLTYGPDPLLSMAFLIRS